MSETAIGQSEPMGEVLEIPLGGAIVRGLRWGKGANWIIFVHDIGQDLDVWRDASHELTRQGYVGLLIDLPGHGLSDDPWEPARLPSVLAAVIATARQSGAKRVFIVAAGELAGLCLAMAELEVDALVALSPQVDTGAEASPDCPVLLFAGAAQVAALAQIRKVFTERSGWTVWSTFPVPEQGTDLLHSAWANNLTEQIGLFLRPYSE